MNWLRAMNTLSPVEVFRATRIICLHELVQLLAFGGCDPARELEFRLLEADLEAVFFGEPHLQHIELQRADHADQRRRAVERAKHLHDALFRHLLQRFFQLLRLHRIAQLHAPENFRREIRHAQEGDLLAFGQTVADAQGAVVGNPDHVAGIGLVSHRAILRKEELRR